MDIVAICVGSMGAACRDLRVVQCNLVRGSVCDDPRMGGGGVERVLAPKECYAIILAFWRSARAERLEWREGWLLRSGASPLWGARRRVVQICVRELGACIDIGRRLERGNVSRGRASGLSNGSDKESGREVLVQARCIPRHFLTSSSASSPGASRGRSGWSGGTAGSKGAVPPPSGAPEEGW